MTDTCGPKLHIRICMGSSCFARGNRKNLSVIREYLKNHVHEGVKVELEGCLCEERCASGPNIRINGKLFENVGPECIAKIIDGYIQEK